MEYVIEQVIGVNPDAGMIVKSTVPVGFTEKVHEDFCCDNILFSPKFLHESRVLHDDFYPIRIIVGVPVRNARLHKAAEMLAGLLKGGAIKENIEARCMNPTEAETAKLFTNTYLALYAILQRAGHLCSGQRPGGGAILKNMTGCPLKVANPRSITGSPAHHR